TLTEGLTLRVAAAAATPTQVELTLLSDPVGSAYPEPFALVRVPASLEYGALWADAAEQALGVLAETGRDDFFVAWEGHSTQGGSLTLRVEGPWLRVSGESPRLSILEDTRGKAAEAGRPWERLAARAPLALSYGSVRNLVLGALGTEAGRASGTCGSEDNDAVTAPHSWYQFCVNLGDLIEVDLGYRLKDGSIRSLARGPTIPEGSTLWTLTADRLAANAVAGFAREGSQVTYDYSDPGFQGEAFIHLLVRDGALRLYHEHASPPHVLQDTGFVVPPDPTRATPSGMADAEDPCAAVGGQPAERGRFLLRFVAGESLTEFSNLSFPVSGRLFAGVFRADEVGLAGPTPGAEQLDTIEADLALDAIPSEIIHETVELPAGSYKVTAYLDLDFVPGEASMVESGDPAVLPFMGTELRCDKQLDLVEFGLTVP
ncbi:MAG: hypothetical protein R3F60_33975, partial [bacterium]